MTARRKIFVKTFGCQMNVYDSERMTELLGADGYRRDGDRWRRRRHPPQHLPHPREGGREGLFRPRPHPPGEGRARSAGKDTIVAVAGCVAQAEGAEMLRRAPVVDLVVGPRAITASATSSPAPGRGAAIVETGFPEEDKFGRLPERAPPKAVTAFLTVQEGCDKFCTFCVVPYTRGAEFSRGVADVEAEARRLADHGVREITLLGQNVNAYHGRGPDGVPWSLARLIARLASIDGIERLRYTTSHPRDMTEDLIAAHAEQEKLMPYLHLPFQAGADRVLAAMNRKHTRRRLPGPCRPHPRRAPDLACPPISSSAFPARPSRVRGHARGGRARRLRPGLLVQVQPASRHARRAMADQVPTPSRSSGCTACKICSTPTNAFNSRVSAR
jgi:tRNA-2-methylthio-N6-dimethylallyladenosine synthase